MNSLSARDGASLLFHTWLAELRNKPRPELAAKLAGLVIEQTLDQLRSVGPSTATAEQVAQSLSFLRLARRMNPEDLTLRTGFIRVALHWGTLHDLLEALDLLESTLVEYDTKTPTPAIDDFLPDSFFPSLRSRSSGAGRHIDTLRTYRRLMRRDEDTPDLLPPTEAVCATTAAKIIPAQDRRDGKDHRFFADLPAPVGVSEEIAAREPRDEDVLVTALCTTYRSARFMEGLLEDLLQQTIAHRLEIIVVDAASPENERTIVAEYAKRHANIHYLRTSKRETSHASIMRAARLARGRYLTLANTDDRHDPRAFEIMADVLDRRPDIALVYADCRATRHENETLEEHTPMGDLLTEPFHPVRLLNRCFVGPQPMWRRDLHADYGHFDPSIDSAGDWELWLRFAEFENFLRIPAFLGLYYYSESSCERRDPQTRQREIEHITSTYDPRRQALQQEAALAPLRCPRLHDVPVAVVVTTPNPEPRSSLVERIQSRRFDDRSILLRLVCRDANSRRFVEGAETDPPLAGIEDFLRDGDIYRYEYFAVLEDTLAVEAVDLPQALATLQAQPELAAVPFDPNARSLLVRTSSALDYFRRAFGQDPDVQYIHSLLAELAFDSAGTRESERSDAEHK